MAISRVSGVADTVTILRKIDKDIVNQARRDLRTGAKPVANAVKSAIPTDAPMSGMVHNGRTAWKPSGVKVTVRTNFSKKAQREGFSLVSIVAGSRAKFAQGSALFAITDIAGRKAKGKTASGRNMIQVLNSRKGRASRFVWPAAERQIPYIIKEVEGTIKRLTTSLNNELKRMR
jgi:hypothetical protein